MSDRINGMFEPNPDKPWLMKFEGDIKHEGVKDLHPYDVPEDHRTENPPKDPWARHAFQICECGHCGGDHRPGCIVIGCPCGELKGMGVWEKVRRGRITPEKGHHYEWVEWPR